MKKVISLLATCLMALSLAACSHSGNEPASAASASPEPQTNISENQPTDEVTPAAESTAEPVSDIPEESLDLQNNDSYFVGIGGKVYFRIPNTDGMRKVALFDNFLGGMNGGTVLQAYDTKSGRIEFVRNDTAACGHMSKCGDYIFYENNSDSDAFGTYNLTAQRVDGEYDDSVNTDGQFYLCGSENGKYFVAIKNYDETNSDLCIYSEALNGKSSGEFPVENFHSTVGIAGDCFCYIACELDASDTWEYFLWSLDLNTKKAIKLGRLPEIESGQFPGEIDQFEGDDNGNICFAYSCYEGTGHFLYKTFAVVANACTADSLVSSELEITEEEVAATFMLDPNSPGYKLTEGIPETAGFKDDKIGYFTIDGVFVPLADAKEWNTDYDSLKVVCYETCGYVYGDVYAVRNSLVRYPDLDVGWREAYYREKVEIVKFDAESGEEEVLITVDGPGDLNTPVTYSDISGKWKLNSFSVESDEMYDAEEMGEDETMLFNEDWTVDYSQKTASGGNVKGNYEVAYESGQLYFEYEQDYGPKTFHIMGLNPEGYLVLQIQFYYGDGTTGSEYALYERVDN